MSDLFDLTGKVAVITGSSRGIGRAIAAEMAAHGARVVISSRKQDACDEVAAEGYRGFVLQRAEDAAVALGPAFAHFEAAVQVPARIEPAGPGPADAALAAAYTTLARLELWSEGQLEEELRALAEQLELKPGQLFGALRVAITGRTGAPPLFETLAALGKERALARIAAARDALSLG